MANEIKYDPAFLRDKAGELRTAEKNYADSIDKLTNLVNGLPDVWSGNAEEKLVTAFKEMMAGFDGMDDTLESYAVALEKSADNMEAADKQYAKTIGAIG